MRYIAAHAPRGIDRDSLGAQDGQRVHGCGAPRRHEARDRRDGGEQHDDGHHDHGVGRRDAHQKARQEPRRCQRDRDAGRDPVRRELQPVTDREPNDVARPSAERRPNPELPLALGSPSRTPARKSPPSRAIARAGRRPPRRRRPAGRRAVRCRGPDGRASSSHRIPRARHLYWSRPRARPTPVPMVLFPCECAGWRFPDSAVRKGGRRTVSAV